MHFVEIFSKRYNKFVEYDSDILKHLTAYHWPGNVRELQHAIERAVILSTGQQLTADDFKLNGTHSAPNSLQEEIKTLNLSQMEKEVIKQALLKCNGNLTRASEELGIGRSTLYRKMEEYGISLRSDG